MSSEPTVRPSPPQKPRRRPRDRKQRIIRAARDLFVEFGYPNVSMGQIADTVGVTAGALYRHVVTKSELLSLVFEESFKWLDEPNSAQSLDDAIEPALDRMAANTYLRVLWVREARFLADQEQVQFRRKMRAYCNRFAKLLGEKRPGLDEAQRDLLAWSVQSLVSSVGLPLIHAQPSSRIPTVRRAINSVACVDLGAQEPQSVRQASALAPISRRELLLQAACVEFARVGYHEASMVAIGSLAGVSGPALYSYFASKADVLRAVYDRTLHALWLGLHDSLSKASDADEALTMLVDSYTQLSRQWPRGLGETSGVVELDAFALEAQREYVGEWVALLRLVRPELDVFHARLHVQIALALLSDLYGISHIRRAAGIERHAARLVRAVLLS